MQQLNDVWTDRKQCYRTHSTIYKQKFKTFNSLFCHAALGNNKDSQRQSCCRQTWRQGTSRISRHAKTRLLHTDLGQQGTSRISRHAKTRLLQADLRLDLHNGLSNCDDHSLIRQHAFQVVQQLLQAQHEDQTSWL